MSALPNDHPIDAQGETPGAELAALVEGLGAHLRRRARLGQRRVPAAPQPGAEPALQRTGPPDAATPPAGRPPWPRAGVPAPASAGASARVPEPQNAAPGAAAPQPTPVRPAVRPSAPPTVRGAAARAPVLAPPGAEDLAQKIAANRAAAAACADLGALREAVARCTACELCQTRRQTVFADGDGSAGVLFVGEAPGANEDEQGVPFVGAAGQLLSDIIHKGMKLDRRHTAIANVLKCRPPGNREPTDHEKALCTPWLDRQIELLAPRVVVALGRHSANHLLGYAGAARRTLGSLRGALHERRGRKVVVTFHPANLLREPENKKECWKDIQLAMRALGLPSAQRSGDAQ